MFEPFKHETKRQLNCFHDHKNLVAGITTRQGGHSDEPFDSLNMGLHVPDEEETVINNRKELAGELGIPLENWIIGEQVHDTRVKVIESGDIGKGAFSHSSALRSVDGVITNQPNVLLGAFYADCVPLLFCDPTSGWIGIAHAGWKGTVQNMAGTMIHRLVEQGCSLENIQMTVGPCIGKDHYEVDERVIAQVPEPFKKETVTPVVSGKYMLDLKKLNQLMALDAGLETNQTEITGYCTYEEEKLFYSHRRDQGKTGRMLGFIGWKG